MKKASKNILPYLFAFIILFFLIAAIFAPLIAPFDPVKQDLMHRLKAPGTVTDAGVHILGTDELGRDLLSRIIYGTRISLLVAFLSVIVSTVTGTWLGMLAGYYKGWVAVLIMRIVDIVLSIPPILLAILTVAVVGPGLGNLVFVLGFTRWPRYARVAYAQTLTVADKPYVQAAQFTSVSTPLIFRRHIIPNIAAPLIVVMTLEFGLMILFEASLSFLGLGVQPPTPSWGAILSTGRNYLSIAWWITSFPGFCLFFLVLSVNMIGDFLRDYLDPHSIRR